MTIKQIVYKVGEEDLKALKNYTPMPCDRKCSQAVRAVCDGCREYDTWSRTVVIPIKQLGLADLVEDYAGILEIRSQVEEVEARLQLLQQELKIKMQNFVDKFDGSCQPEVWELIDPTPQKEEVVPVIEEEVVPIRPMKSPAAVDIPPRHVVTDDYDVEPATRRDSINATAELMDKVERSYRPK